MKERGGGCGGYGDRKIMQIKRDDGQVLSEVLTTITRMRILRNALRTFRTRDAKTRKKSV